jgi:predicted enzyme related to lactoylglutathione lyase
MKIDAQITFLPCSDLAISRAFYTDVLGLEVAVDQGSCLILAVADNAYVGVCERTDVGPNPSVIVTFVTDDVDGWCDRIINTGGFVHSGPEHSDQYGIYHAFVHDPDGNVLEIQRFDDSSWADRSHP